MYLNYDDKVIKVVRVNGYWVPILEDSNVYVSCHFTDGKFKSIGTVKDYVDVDVDDGVAHQLISDEVAVATGIAVNTTNYPLALDTGTWRNELTAGGTETGVIGTDSTSGAGTLTYQLATEIEYENCVKGNLESYPDGTIGVSGYENFTSQAVAGVITIPRNTLEDYYIESINKIDYVKLKLSDGSLIDVAVTSVADTTITLDTTDDNYDADGWYEIGYFIAGTVPTIEYKYPLNIAGAVSTLSSGLNELNKQVSEMNGFTVAMLLDHETRITTLET